MIGLVHSLIHEDTRRHTKAHDGCATFVCLGVPSWITNLSNALVLLYSQSRCLKLDESVSALAE